MLDSVAQQAAQTEERRILTCRQCTKRGFRLIVAAGKPARLGCQQQGLRRIAQQTPRATGLASRIALLAGGKRQQRARHSDLACAPAMRRASDRQRARQPD